MSSSSLKQASLAALAAAQAGDLDAVERALIERQAALDRGETPSPGILSSGELVAELLRDLIREIRLEDARLRRLANGFVADVPPSIDYLG
jgi:hypothetical protein